MGQPQWCDKEKRHTNSSTSWGHWGNSAGIQWLSNFCRWDVLPGCVTAALGNKSPQDHNKLLTCRCIPVYQTDQNLHIDLIYTSSSLGKEVNQPKQLNHSMVIPSCSFFRSAEGMEPWTSAPQIQKHILPLCYLASVQPLHSPVYGIINIYSIAGIGLYPWNCSANMLRTVLCMMYVPFARPIVL